MPMVVMECRRIANAMLNGYKKPNLGLVKARRADRQQPLLLMLGAHQK